MLKEIPQENQITRFLLQYGFFINEGLHYDALRIIYTAQESFPGNEIIEKLKNSFLTRILTDR